jgi:hypothetical protein
MRKKEATIRSHPSPTITKLTYVGVWGFQAFVFIFECPHDAPKSLEWLYKVVYG